jgi:hypothetical protein
MIGAFARHSSPSTRRCASSARLTFAISASVRSLRIASRLSAFFFGSVVMGPVASHGLYPSCTLFFVV